MVTFWIFLTVAVSLLVSGVSSVLWGRWLWPWRRPASLKVEGVFQILFGLAVGVVALSRLGHGNDLLYRWAIVVGVAILSLDLVTDVIIPRRRARDAHRSPQL